jgi:Ser/Thr protein kinase RdoA (MazF antagonist)
MEFIQKICGRLKMKNNYNFNEIVKHFKFEGKFIEANSYGQGHINDTFEVRFKKEDGKIRRYIMQRINTTIFKTPEKLMDNIENVTEHIKKKISEEDGNCERETLNLVRALDEKAFYKSEEGDYWRSYIFIEGAQTYQVVENLNHFYNSGKALGKFQQLLSDFPADKLYETIPNFHNTEKRFEDFMNSVKKNTAGRLDKVASEVEFVMKRYDDTKVLTNLVKEGMLPLRVTHNDTKFNNVMIDDVTNEGICVIDLDTVMPGLSLYDFGDSIRSGANPAEEDETDLSKVWMELELFEAFTKGFLETAGKYLTRTEIEYLPFSAKLMTFECGMRFLADYLDGDVYFKVHREHHNLDRARTQFKMVADMESKLEEMKTIIAKYIVMK